MMPDERTRRIVEGIWREVLPVERLDEDDNFFDLGGTSPDAIAVVDRLNEEFGTDVSGIGLFERPTIRGMVALLTGAAPVDGDGSDPGTRDSQRRGESRRAIRLTGIPSDDPG